MNEKPKFILPERNPRTHAAHRRQVWWQITLPLLLGCLLLAVVIAGVVWAATDPTSEISRWADVSLMWVMLPAFGAAILLLTLLIGVTYLVSKLLGIVPGYARVLQDYFTAGKLKVMQFSNLLVKPVLKIRSWSAGAGRARKVVTEPLAGKADDDY